MAIATERGLAAAVRRVTAVDGWSFYRRPGAQPRELVAMPPDGTKPSKLHGLAVVLRGRGVNVSVGLTASPEQDGGPFRTAILLRVDAKPKAARAAKRGSACDCAETNAKNRARGWTEGYSCDKCRGGQAKQSEGDRQTEGYIGVIRRSGQANRGGA